MSQKFARRWFAATVEHVIGTQTYVVVLDKNTRSFICDARRMKKAHVRPKCDLSDKITEAGNSDTDAEAFSVESDKTQDTSDSTRKQDTLKTVLAKSSNTKKG